MSNPLTEVGVLLDAVEKYIRRYVKMSDDEACTAAAWALHTWVFRQSTVTPYLAVTSPIRRCGKSNLLFCLANITNEGEVLFDPTASSLYRIIEASENGPSLMWDELDFTKPSHQIIAILNSGYKKGGTVPRTEMVGGIRVIKRFSTFCPKAFGAIGQVLPPTQIDRSIQIRLTRALPNEQGALKEYDEEIAKDEAAPIRLAMEAFSEFWERPKVRPMRPLTLNARQKELWLPLLEIGSTAGGDWFKRLSDAAKHICDESNRSQFTDDTVDLLSDIHSVLDGWDKDKIFSRTMLTELGDLEDGVYSGHATNTMRLLALFLSANFGIHPTQIRIGQRTGAGYYAADFKDAFARYL